MSDKAKKAKKAAARYKGLTPNKPVRTPEEGNKTKLIRFGQQGVKGSPKKDNESESYKKRRESFKARHAKNIKKGKMSAAYWADREKW